MINAVEARAMATEHSYEKKIRAAAGYGYFETKVFFVDENTATTARGSLMTSGFICSKIIPRYTRDGTDYLFDVRWN